MSKEAEVTHAIRCSTFPFGILKGAGQGTGGFTMHIPDGYLSPSTCATLYASAVPFWALALKRIKRQLHTRFLPLISMFSAFSFVIMMFNLPLPGGTTGHATGIGLAAVLLGPWAGVLAISTALLIQAVFFGDGGVLTLGANCFNIAIVGTFVAAAVYRLIGRNAPATSTRRVVAAGIAGYLGINVAALLTAVQFGVQPALFHEPNGLPMYAPYPLAIAIPAMMIGHLTFAGFAEFIITAGVVAFLQRSDPSLLTRTAGSDASVGHFAAGGLRRVWVALAALMVLTPIGLLTAGTAWGEWSVTALSNPATRHEIASASRGVELPSSVPSGLSKLATVWTAPIPAYAPPVLKSASFGYMLSAMTGTGLILLCYFALSWMMRRLPN